MGRAPHEEGTDRGDPLSEVLQPSLIADAPIDPAGQTVVAGEPPKAPVGLGLASYQGRWMGGNQLSALPKKIKINASRALFNYHV